MNHKIPSEENKSAITLYLKDTFSNTRYWMQKSNPSISDINKKYGCLMDYNGDLVNILIFFYNSSFIVRYLVFAYNILETIILSIH